jgi:predicted nucleic acid-binding protein
LGLKRLRAFLGRWRRISIDTNVFIYALEFSAKYADLVYEVLKWVQSPGHSAVTSTLTLTELLTRPYSLGQADRAQDYYELLSEYPHLEWVAPDLEIADLAAQFRAQHRMRTPDAIQAATAVQSGATGFISNDPVFLRVKAFETLVLDDLL